MLTAGAVYLILQRGMVRIVFGFVLLSNAVNLFLVTIGGTSRRDEPIGSALAQAADPVPQSFVLTAIVISFAVTVFMLTLASVFPNDDTNDKSETHHEDDFHPEEDHSL